MKHVSKRTKSMVLVVALAMGAFAAWSDGAAPTDSEFRHLAEPDTLQYGYRNVYSIADLFPPGR